MQEDVVTVLARVSGRVQGVCFRAATQRAARSFSVAGWVRNLPDGSVEAVFQGKKQDVEAVLAWCWKGPPLAHVRDVKVEPLTGSEPYTSFGIRY